MLSEVCMSGDVRGRGSILDCSCVTDIIFSTTLCIFCIQHIV